MRNKNVDIKCIAHATFLKRVAAAAENPSSWYLPVITV
jgi:hypothetical protein